MKREDELCGLFGRLHWELDEDLSQIERQSQPGRTEAVALRMKAWHNTFQYRGSEQDFPLQHNGTSDEVIGHAHLLVPIESAEVKIVQSQSASHTLAADNFGAGAVWWQEVAVVQSIYFREDEALAVADFDIVAALDDSMRGRIWQAFECWLILRFPDATHIFTYDSGLGNDSGVNQAFLSALGYELIADTDGIFIKHLTTKHRE